jgi:hypothetical protein
MRVIASSVLTLCLAACGGGEGSSGDPYEPSGSTGGEASPRAERRGEAGDAKGVTPSGPARITVRVLVEDEPVAGHVQLLDRGGDVVKEGRSGETFAVPAGQYTIVAQIKDANVLVDKPTRQFPGIFLEEGEELTEDVEIGRARVRLRVVKAGREVRNARIQLRRSGAEEVVLDYTPGNDHISITPGRYDATVHIAGAQIRVEGLIFQPSATQNMPININ